MTNRDEILKEIRSFYEQQQWEEKQSPDEITYRDLMDDMNIGRDTARSIMDKLIERGLYVREERTINKHRRIVFRRINGTNLA